MHQIIIDGITIEVVRKKIKHLRLIIYAKTGKVRASVPLRTKDAIIQNFVTSKLPWIKKHQTKFSAQTLHTVLEYTSGETHYYQGKPYLLNVIEHSGNKNFVIKNESGIALCIKHKLEITQRQRLLFDWYRQEFEALVIPLIQKWETIIGVKTNAWRIRLMKSRWGSCNTQKQVICLNLDLIRRPLHCIEYVIVHELVHLLEKTHNWRFKSFMNQFMPKWLDYKKELNSL